MRSLFRLQIGLFMLGIYLRDVICGFAVIRTFRSTTVSGLVAWYQIRAAMRGARECWRSIPFM